MSAPFVDFCVGNGWFLSSLPSSIPQDLSIEAGRSGMRDSVFVPLAPIPGEPGMFLLEYQSDERTGGEDSARKGSYRVSIDQFAPLYTALVQRSLERVTMYKSPMIMAQPGSSSITISWSGGDLHLYEGGSRIVTAAFSSAYFSALGQILDFGKGLGEEKS